ncbi:hypothetical protein QYM36_013375 [Artemia franciscana]|uniref:Uncharacterized protein n=1 Tax=Artemia franciscana TaxID=6661 RepID=A0AA88HMA8_ARTSF|nr:hypothetical protein QYM36_013375 [Artemia franciscana]
MDKVLRYGPFKPHLSCEGKTCTKSKKPNHFARVRKCKKSVNAVMEYKESPADNSDGDEDVFLYAIENKTNKNRYETLVTLEVSHSLPVKFKVDRGAQANILPAKFEPVNQKTILPYSLPGRHNIQTPWGKILEQTGRRLGYWLLVLDDESAHLTTFNTIFGRHRFKQMPFGIISAQDEFQRRMEEALEGLDGFTVIIDDLLIFGVLERARAKGIKFNKAKCSFCVTIVTYFGHVISEQRMQPDADKLEAINNMPITSNLEELATLVAPARAQQMMLQIQPNDLEFSYRPKTKITIADTLSRLHLPDIDKKLHREIEVYVHQITHVLAVSSARLNEIQLCTKEDEHLIHLREAIQGRWPNTRKQ